MSLLRQAAMTASINWYLDSQNNEYCMKWMEISYLHELLVCLLSFWEQEVKDDERCDTDTKDQYAQLQWLQLWLSNFFSTEEHSDDLCYREGKRLDYADTALAAVTCFIPGAVILFILHHRGLGRLLAEPVLLGYKFQWNNVETDFSLPQPTCKFQPSALKKKKNLLPYSAVVTVKRLPSFSTVHIFSLCLYPLRWMES